jgi:Reverse transcriptase (RNA-dependent DNA polymerase).
MPFQTLLGLSRKSGLKHSEFLAIVSKISLNYRSFRIPKRSGGSRVISAPKPGLMAIQRVIADEIRARSKINSNVVGYVHGKSIKSHAGAHLTSTAFIKIDVQDFFPSITEEKVYRALRGLGFSESILPTLVRISCLNGALPQGSPASPPISNIVLSDADTKLTAFAAAHKLTYTRYADDIVLSGHVDDYQLADLAIDIVEQEGFRVNVFKSFFAHRPKKMILTGLSIASGDLKVPRSFKRTVRQDAYRLAAQGTAVMFRDGKFDPFTFDRILGKLTFWSWVEPQAKFPKRYIALFSERYSKGRSFPPVLPS